MIWRRCWGKSPYESLVDDLITTKRLRVQDLAGVLAEIGRRGKPGTRIVRQIVTERREGGDYADATPLERLGRSVMRDSQLPEAVEQLVAPFDPSIVFDVAFPEQRIAVEWDSVAWHTSRQRFESDRERDRRAARAGWLVLRFTYRDLDQRPADVVRDISEALNQRQTA